ncbi:glycosyltransferase family 2 protein [Oscillatoria sp. FACHB-1407]|uniref:glycosyltransferase n=1 Tax=Oscillatoria sp. FACHB-1407 TaxID=2692847 RepID=UPI0016823833|nr:glycosyltransferase family 2 protein [Oscillatoria sp. FACHB-1407]MBD2460672.1 glycosyltransferase family 2 protein [Oscillatoria sp. FACHB-1407]
MPGSTWYDSDSYNELEPISALTSDLSEIDDINTHYYRGLGGRRRKAALALTVIWSSTIALHLVSWGSWFVLCVTTFIGIHLLRMLMTRSLPVPQPLTEQDPEKLPFVSLLVAAKNEEAVIPSLVKTLCSLDYPASRYELWVINDNSSDRTGVLLDRLAKDYEQLRVVHRAPDAGGGKSGALNDVWTRARGEILGVFDADAQVPQDLLRRVLPLFERQEVGAVQVRKAIAQAQLATHPDAKNFWIQGQVAEMAIDSYFQQQRIALGGIGELRGNGQFVRRVALASCGGWNEETITDDLDLTVRLHLDHWDIDFLMFPPVIEEGVTRAVGLWHQRNRWAEGGYQRYLDYWRLLARNRLGTRKTVDLFIFWLLQYIMPTAALPDMMMAIARNTMPIFAPMTSLTLTMTVLGMMIGLKRMRLGQATQAQTQHSQSPWTLFFEAVRGTFYMLHWFPVIISMSARLSIRPKQLKWVKTAHHGTDEVWLDVSEQQ